MYQRPVTYRPAHRAALVRARRQWRSGLTLSEVIVASGLLVISIVPILRALAIGQATDRAIEGKTRSLMFAQQELERIAGRSIYHYEESFVSSESLGGGYLCTVSDDCDPDLREIVVSVGLDANDDGLLGVDEIDVRLATQLARRWPGAQ